MISKSKEMVIRICSSIVGLTVLAWISHASAGTNDVLVGLDEAGVAVAAGGQPHAPSTDSVIVLDTTDSAHPKIAKQIFMRNSISGPPVNLKISRDGSLGLISSSLTSEMKDGKWSQLPDHILHVIDVNSLVELSDVAVGTEPSGVAISHDGMFGLVANRNGKSVSVLKIDGKSVAVTGEVALPDNAVSVAITLDGRRGFVALENLNRIGVLKIDGGKVTYNSDDDIAATGLKPYSSGLTPDGKLFLVANLGQHGSASTITVIDALASHPHVVDTISVGDTPEGFAISPNGKSVALGVVHGSSVKPDEWFYHSSGYISLLSVEAGKLHILPGQISVGASPQAVVFSHDGKYVYAASAKGTTMHILRVTVRGLEDTGKTLELPGHPAAAGGVQP